MTEKTFVSRALSGPEHQQVRLPILEDLKKLGWDGEQLLWSPEWRVPKSPHDASKREDGVRFDGWPVDLALFDSAEHAGDWRYLAVIFEFKAPTISSGTSQLEIYLAREPRARLGYWTNGHESIRVYQLADGTFKHVPGGNLPRPGENLEQSNDVPLTYADLVVPTSSNLKSTFKRLLDVVVARDSRATRSETQLNELCNLLLLKLESDTAGSHSPDSPLEFQLASAGEAETAKGVRRQFEQLVKFRPEVFTDVGDNKLLLDDHTIHEVVYELSGLDLVGVKPDAISSAFQIFRRANLKAGEGQYFTPERVISSAIDMLEITPRDKIIDPACGTGGFLVDAFLKITQAGLLSGSMSEANARSWAHRNVFGVDKDSINVKLTRAIMVSLGDGSVNIHAGDSIREDRWMADYPHLFAPLRDGSFTVVVTNPPFGQNLKVGKNDLARNKYSIAKRGNAKYVDLEIGLVFLERSYKLLMDGGRLGIVLPETYFFSSTYSWLTEWLESRFVLRGMVNIPMEAFQGFCRAKTNFYVFEKRVTNA
ncbi:class I SAM-dependent DNA methyltransferase [Rhodococcus sp. I2R]|uniref:HsdM family class I SAM-dependent methyltransferase n=1 Tax=Rhodococcus sp. I2R TaxID=2855445 RepID=UPI001E5CC2B2|nr:N-6 DNA methylase [Rhodococcus sp. I2R]MCC8929012.1 SAM-dependent methyltransferase [Rhodococcus sp. I2R]